MSVYVDHNGDAVRVPCMDDSDLWVPLHGEGHTPYALIIAKEGCARCPIRGACLEDALRNGDDFGIRGGTTGPERKLIRERRETRKVKKGRAS